MAKTREQVALVTVANRGIGFEVCRQLATRGFTVLLTARDAAKAGAAASRLLDAGTVEALLLDVADAASIQKAAAEVANRYDHLDVLVNNAAINYDTWETVENADVEGTVNGDDHDERAGAMAYVPGIPAAAKEESSSPNRKRVVGIGLARTDGSRCSCLSGHEGSIECHDTHSRR